MSAKREQRDGSYPRPKYVRILRELLKLWWLLFAIYPSNVVFNISSLLANGGTKAVENGTNLRQALLLSKIARLWNTEPWIIATAGVAAATLVLSGRWAVHDKHREEHALRELDATKERQARDDHVLGAATTVAQTAAQTETLTVLRNINTALARSVGDRLRSGVATGHSGHDSWVLPQDDSLLLPPESFVGRKADLAWVMNQLTTGVKVVGIRGMAGIGKTGLAATAIKRCRELGHFKDGIVVVFCHSTVEPVEVVQRIVSRFDVNESRSSRESLSELIILGRRLLGERQALAVLDNVEPMLPIEEVIGALTAIGFRTLITSRHIIPSNAVPASAVREIGLLSKREAIKLFSKNVISSRTSTRISADRNAVERIVLALERHTLAVKLAASYASDTRRDLHVLAEELERDPLGLPQGDTPRAVALAFMESIRLLSDEGRRSFALFGAFNTLSFGRRAVLAVASTLNIDNARGALDQLVLRSLVESFVDRSMPLESDRERLRLHPLMQRLAFERFRDLADEDRCRVRDGVSEYYSNYAQANQTSYISLRRDEENIEEATRWACSRESHDTVIRMCLGMIPYWLDRWRTSTSHEFLSMAVELISDNQLDSDVERIHSTADIRLAYAQVLWRQGATEEAEEALIQNLSLRESTGDQSGECVVRHSLAALTWRSGRLQQAEEYLHAGIGAARALSNISAEADMLTMLGRIARDRGRLDEGTGYLNQGLTLSGRIGDQGRIGKILEELGIIAQDTGRLNESDELLHKSLAIAQTTDDQREVASITARLAHIAGLQGDLEASERLYLQSLTLFEELGDRRACGWAMRRLGEILIQSNDLTRAEACITDALNIARQSSDRRNEGFALGVLGDLFRRKDDLDDAETSYNEALACAQAAGNRRGVALALAGLAALARSRGDASRADNLYRQTLEVFSEVSDRISEAAVCADYGEFLVVDRAEKDRGCRYLEKALAVQEELGLHSMISTRETISRLDC